MQLRRDSADLGIEVDADAWGRMAWAVLSQPLLPGAPVSGSAVVNPLTELARSALRRLRPAGS